MKTILKLTSLATATVVLTACSIAKPTLGQGQDAAGATAGSNNAAAQAYGLQSAPAAQSNNGRHVNAMTAPANQTYYFAFNNSATSSDDAQSLRLQANYLATHSKAKIVLQGNTDDRGSREYNVGLGWRRDQSIARFMEQQGVKPSQIQMVSFGKERPAVLGENEHSWSLNRRVNLVYKAS